MSGTDVKTLSYEELEKKFGGILRTFASWRIVDQTYEDLYQELRLVLWNAQRAYRPGGKAAFQTYLYRACVNKVGKLLHKTRAQKRVPKDLLVTLCDGHVGEPSGYCAVCHELPTTELDTEIFDLLMNASLEAQQLAGLVLYGDTTRDSWLRRGLTNGQIKKGINDLKEVLQRR